MVVRVRRRRESLEPDGPHDPHDALVVDRRAALLAEFCGDSGGSVGAVGVLVSLAYPGRGLGFDRLAVRSRGCGAAPMVEARAGQAEDVAEPLTPCRR